MFEFLKGSKYKKLYEEEIKRKSDWRIRFYRITDNVKLLSVHKSFSMYQMKAFKVPNKVFDARTKELLIKALAKGLSHIVNVRPVLNKGKKTFIAEVGAINITDFNKA